MASKKGPTKGTGGHGRRRLQGRGPTPAAQDRPGHPAQRRARAAAKRAASSSRGDGGGRAARGRAGSSTADLVAGRNAVVEALRAGVPSTALYIALGLEHDRRIDEARRLATQAEITISDVPRPDLDRLTSGAPHQGLALAARPFDYLAADDLLRRVVELSEPPLVIALDGISDPHNLGAIARSAAAFGAHGLLLAQRRSAGVTPAAWKASAGSLARLPVARATNLVRTLGDYAQAGLMLAGLDGAGEIDLDRLELATGPLVLVIGAEGRGLSRLVAERCDLTVRIPLAGPVESLNASVAAGVALAEIARRRQPG
ncbi:MAG TPA: 23S rRNA (guanosine(2251)-2'-O)-methyltransferase RlmB [Mycobacteriales bacterium]|nr:23S rRNA (guanosine(2251)-2'-O)-methyltransferase RlmB [Mycobacteriales bacterium]